MASVYKFRRKGKEDAEKQGKKDQNNDFFPRLFEEQASENTSEAKTPESDEKENTTIFTPSTEKEIPQDLLDALSIPKVDAEKMDAIFNHPKEASSSGGDETDKTASILKEIFGSAFNPTADKKAEESPKTESDDYVAVHDGEEDRTRDYIAIHDGEDESTKEYHTTSSIAEFLESGEAGDMATRAVPPLAEEVHVASEDISADPYSDTYEELEQKIERHPILPEEYTSYEEYDEFAEHLRNKNFRNLCSTLWTFLIFAVTLYLESACFSNIFHPSFLTPGGIYNMIYLLVDLQLIFISALLILPSLGNGITELFRGRPNRNTIAFMMHLFPALHTVVLLIFGAKEYPLFGCVGALFAFLTAISNFLDSKRMYRSFRMFGRKGEKLVAKSLDDESPEAETFRDQLAGDPVFFSVQKANFIEGFFRRSNEKARCERSFGIVLILSLIASIAFAVISYLKEPSVVQTATSFMTMSVMTLPLSALFTVSLPFSHLSAKAEKNGAAILSAAAAEKYAAADVVSFTDKEIFPPKSVKVTTIRTYGRTRIDKAILYSAMIFQKLGGPLSEVFKKTISGVYDQIPEDFDFNEITSDGMCAKINNCDVFVGNKDYLLSYDFGYTKDEQDEAFEEKSGKIMYMVIDGEFAAKFYIRYSISKQFKKTILTLYRSGICPAVKTCDPNIDSDLFRTLLQNKSIPSGIIKSCEAMKYAPAAETSDSGIVCTSTIAKMLQTFKICESLRHLTRANVVMKLISLILGAGIVGFLFYIESLTKITGLFALIYHLLWLIPVIIPSMTE